jgi:hypothetical protein
MPTIHCHVCGGFIADPAGTIYRKPNAAPPAVVPRSALCTCEHAVVYEAAPELGGELLHDVYDIRSSSRR